jgi:hypothetical protein
MESQVTKTVPITEEAHERLLKHRNLLALKNKRYKLSLKETLSKIIIDTPLPHSNNGHNHTEEVEEDTND